MFAKIDNFSLCTLNLFSKHSIFPTEIKITNNCSCFLSFDYGTKRIGVAIGNNLTNVANSLSIIKYTSRKERFTHLSAVVNKYKPHYLIVGLPLYSDGICHELSRASCNFGLDLQRYFNLPIIWVDERYSTSILHKKQDQYVDDASAQLILQQFLNNADNFYFNHICGNDR